MKPSSSAPAVSHSPVTQVYYLNLEYFRKNKTWVLGAIFDSQIILKWVLDFNVLYYYFLFFIVNATVVAPTCAAVSSGTTNDLNE